MSAEDYCTHKKIGIFLIYYILYYGVKDHSISWTPSTWNWIKFKQSNIILAFMKGQFLSDNYLQFASETEKARLVLDTQGSAEF